MVRRDMRMVARGGVVRRVPEKGVVERRVFGRGNVEVDHVSL